MKNIEQLNNMERAAMLYALFPTEIPALIDFAKGIAESISQDEARQREQWNNGFYSFDFWIAQVDAVASEITGHKTGKFTKMEFSIRLFEGYKAMFMHYCMSLYTTTRQHPNAKFSQAVDLLFEVKTNQP